MTVNVEVGGVNANSYVTVAEADAYFDIMFGKDLWIDADPYDKDGLVVLASKTLDQYMIWFGERATSEQSMEWPRIDVPYVGIPQRLKEACFELAFHILTNGGISFTNQNVDAVKIGPISVDFSAGAIDSGIPNFIERMLSSLGSPLMTGNTTISVAKVVRT